MSFLQSMQDICDEIGLPRPTSIVGSSGERERKLLAIAHRVANDIRQAGIWPELNRRTTITLSASVESYALPDDFDKEVHESHFNTSTDWPLYGPISEQQWVVFREAGPQPTFTQRYRIKGCSLKQLFIDPIPTATGDIIAYEYQSTRVFRPRTWTSGMTVTAASYCFYDGYYFYSASSGTTGASAPTPSSLNDGGITWTLYTGSYERVLADTDEIVTDLKLFELGVQWNYLASKTLPYEHLQKKYEGDLRRAPSKKRGAKTIYLSSAVRPRYWFNVPETGFGE